MESSGLVLRAMLFAMEKHPNQNRNYTEVPYIEHLAEVAAMTHAFGGLRGGSVDFNGHPV